MADDDGKLVVTVLPKAEKQEASDGVTTMIMTYNVTTVIPPGGTACLAMRMLQDGPYVFLLSTIIRRWCFGWSEQQCHSFVVHRDTVQNLDTTYCILLQQHATLFCC